MVHLYNYQHIKVEHALPGRHENARGRIEPPGFAKRRRLPAAYRLRPCAPCTSGWFCSNRLPGWLAPSSPGWSPFARRRAPSIAAAPSPKAWDDDFAGMPALGRGDPAGEETVAIPQEDAIHRGFASGDQAFRSGLEIASTRRIFTSSRIPSSSPTLARNPTDLSRL